MSFSLSPFSTNDINVLISIVSKSLFAVDVLNESIPNAESMDAIVLGLFTISVIVSIANLADASLNPFKDLKSFCSNFNTSDGFETPNSSYNCSQVFSPIPLPFNSVKNVTNEPTILYGHVLFGHLILFFSSTSFVPHSQYFGNFNFFPVPGLHVSSLYPYGITSPDNLRIISSPILKLSFLNLSRE